MTTEEMRLALLHHFRFRLQYPLVVTECNINGYLADILAIHNIVVEVEIKRHLSEITQDLNEKARKHSFYLECQVPDYGLKPNKFYFALPSNSRGIDEEKYNKIIPKPYGLILVRDYNYHQCQTVKQARYLTKKNEGLRSFFKDILSKRLTSENIDLREKLKGVRNEE